VDKAREGTVLVEKAGDTIQALVIDVKRVSGLMAQIAEASAEQSRGVEQVNKTVTEMDRVVQQNASAVLQSASAAEAMKLEAQALVRAVSAFRVEGTHAAPAPREYETRVAQQPAAPAPSPEPAARPAAAAEPARTPALAGGNDDWQEF
jgi:methyl-accepting chemotaxis protein